MNHKKLQKSNSQPGGRRFPPWLRAAAGNGRKRQQIQHILRDLKLNTVCESAKCPNQGECWGRGTATFMILGRNCTRNCRFCAVTHGCPEPVTQQEPERIAEAVEKLSLSYAVITCVTRDDLPDGGAGHFLKVIEAIRRSTPQIGIEVLTSDFGGNLESLRKVLTGRPNVFNHNLETCERLTGKLRDKASYRRSLNILKEAARSGAAETLVKSGFMAGLGETEEDVWQMLRDLREHGVQIVTIGQYLQPSPGCLETLEFITPERFDSWRKIGLQEFGFSRVESGPLVRSSYKAEQAINILS